MTTPINAHACFPMVDPGAALEAVDSLPRFWRADWKSFTFYQCLKEYDDCLGGGIVGSGNGTAAAANATFEQQQRDATAAQVVLDREKAEQERLEQSKTLLRKAKGAGKSCCCFMFLCSWCRFMVPVNCATAFTYCCMFLCSWCLYMVPVHCATSSTYCCMFLCS
jgi:hypothetical protein